MEMPIDKTNKFEVNEKLINVIDQKDIALNNDQSINQDTIISMERLIPKLYLYIDKEKKEFTIRIEVNGEADQQQKISIMEENYIFEIWIYKSRKLLF